MTAPGDGALTRGEALVAVDVGGTTTRTGALRHGEAPGRMARSLSRDLGADPVAGLAQLIRAAAPGGARLAGAVVGLPVSFDAACRVALSSPNLPGLEGRAVGQELAARLGVPVVVERDTVLLATGEWVAGAGRGAPTLLGAFVGTGIGGCLLVEGRPFRGASGGSIEIGHVPVRDHGAPCVCGNTDCLEAYASGHALAAAAEAAGVPVEDVFAHPAAAAGVERYLHALAHGLAAAANVLDPHVLLIGGGLHGRPAFPRGRLAARVRAHLRAPVPRDHLVIVSAALGSEAAMHAAPRLLAAHRKGTPC